MLDFAPNEPTDPIEGGAACDERDNANSARAEQLAEAMKGGQVQAAR